MQLLRLAGRPAAALALGFLAAVAVTIVLNAVLPPFRPEDDDTLRERIPVALTYLAGIGTAALTLLAGWLRSTRGAASK